MWPMPAEKISSNNNYLFEGQDTSASAFGQDQKPATNGFWRVLIVDDEPEIHKVTTMALSGIIIAEKRLEFLHAHSAKEAEEILTKQPGIAVILLDVVMESDDAGLKLVKTIRNQLKMQDIRIILRTGQPGYAPEEQVVIDYEINDYIMKTDMTRSKLLTSICAAIRAFQQLRVISDAKDFLQRLTIMNSSLISQKSYDAFVRCLVSTSLELFKAKGPGVFLLNDSSIPSEKNKYRIEYSSEPMYSFSGQFYEDVLPKESVKKVRQAISNEMSVIEDRHLVLFIPSKSCAGILILFDAFPTIARTELIESFVSNIASDLDNSLLLKQVSDIAYLDSLTNLPNRTKFIEYLDDFSQSKNPLDTVALVDIEHFSDINDGLGQDVGNLVILAVAERIANQLDDDVLVCRVGADIFGLMGRRISLEPEKILATFDCPFKAGDNLIPINARVGICYKPDKPTTGLTIIKHANIALNLAKKDSQNRTNVYQSDMEDETSWRLSMIRKLTDDFFDNKLQVWYQPQLNVQTNKVVGVEALLRWPNGEGGYISPLTFIPLAEYTGLIVDIGAWVLEQACNEVNIVSEFGFPDLRIAVNVSMPQFKNVRFVDDVIATAERFNVKPENIELEITESVVMDDTSMVVKALERLRSYGFTIAIDDFGTGFSSLSYLHKLPLNRLKIDREFIREIGEGGDGILAETIINLGQKLGLETIAEGIETEFQLNYVKRLGCNEAQGFYHAKPMPADELKKFLLQLDDNKSQTQKKA